MRRQQFGKRNKGARRFYCDYCKVWVIGERADIKNHNGTAIHRRNYQRDLDEKHDAARKKKIESGYYDDKQELLEEYSRGQDKKLQRKEKYEENKFRNHQSRNNEGGPPQGGSDSQLLSGAVSKE